MLRRMPLAQSPALAALPEHANSELLLRPKQVRSRASLMRILGAAEIVLRDEGLEAFSIARIAELSGVSVGGIYRRVKSKAGLLQAIKDAAMGRIEDAISFALERRKFDDFEALLGALVQAILNSFVRHEALHRILFQIGGSDPAMSARGIKGRAKTRQMFVTSALPLFTNPMAARARLAAALTYDMVSLMFIDRVRADAEQVRDVSWQRLGKELVSAGVAYLLAIDRSLSG